MVGDALCGELQVSGRAFEQCDIPGHKRVYFPYHGAGGKTGRTVAASLEIQETIPQISQYLQSRELKITQLMGEQG